MVQESVGESGSEAQLAETFNWNSLHTELCLVIEKAGFENASKCEMEIISEKVACIMLTTLTRWDTIEKYLSTFFCSGHY